MELVKEAVAMVLATPLLDSCTPTLQGRRKVISVAANRCSWVDHTHWPDVRAGHSNVWRRGTTRAQAL